MVHINRKQYWQIFVALFLLTVVEVAVAYLDTSWSLVVSALLAALGLSVAGTLLAK